MKRFPIDLLLIGIGIATTPMGVGSVLISLGVAKLSYTYSLIDLYISNKETSKEQLEINNLLSDLYFTVLPPEFTKRPLNVFTNVTTILRINPCFNFFARIVRSWSSRCKSACCRRSRSVLTNKDDTPPYFRTNRPEANSVI